MGRRGIAAAVLAAAVLLAGAASFAAPTPGRLFADKRPGAVPVDVELVLAVDISYSMDPEEQALQREGYVQALTSSEFLRALREGANGKIAVTYVEWAGAQEQRIIVPWRLVEGPFYDNQVATLTIDGRAAELRLERTVGDPESDHRELHKSFERPIA